MDELVVFFDEFEYEACFPKYELFIIYDDPLMIHTATPLEKDSFFNNSVSLGEILWIKQGIHIKFIDSFT